MTDDAVATLARSVEAAEDAGARVELVRSLGHLALAQCRAGAEENARALAVRGDEVLTEVTAPPGSAFLQSADGTIALARAHAELGDPDRARGVLATVADAADRAGWREVAALAALARGLDGGGRSSLEHALAIADAAGLPGVSWRARGALARWVDRSEAERQLALASEIVAVLAGTIDDRAFRDTFENAAAAEIVRLAG
jgi:hypothetical protein